MAVGDDFVTAMLFGSQVSDEKPDELSSSASATWADENPISTLLTSSKGSSEKPEEFSPEDAAWVDSCFVVDPNMSDDSWGSLREALLETLAVHATFQETSSMGYFDDIVEDHSEHVQDSEDEEMMATSDEEHDMPEKPAESMMIREGEHVLPENPESGGDTNTEEGFVGSLESLESRENIFPVWNLETPDEEDELIKQLTKILAESKAQAASPASDETIITQSEGNIDELVTSMGDLSLKPYIL